MSNNNPHPDRPLAVPKRRLNRDASSGSISSVGSAASASNSFSFGGTPAGFGTSQPEPFRFGSSTPPAFGESNISPFGQPTSTTATTNTATVPTTAQPFQFSAAGNNAFQFGSANVATSASFQFNAPTSAPSGFQFGSSNASTSFGFGSNIAGNTQSATASPFQFGAGNTSSTASPFKFGTSTNTGNTSNNAFQFGTSTFNPQSQSQTPAAAATTATAGSFTFGATSQREETMQTDDDMMTDDDSNTESDNNNALVLSNQRTATEPTTKNTPFAFGTTPPQQDRSVSSPASTPFKQFGQSPLPQQQQSSDFFSVISNQQSSSTTSSPLAFGSPAGATQMRFQKPPAPPNFSFGKKDENKSSLSFGTTPADLEDPFNSTPVHKANESAEKEKDDSSIVVIEDVSGDEEPKDGSKDQASSEEAAGDNEYQIVEPEDTNADSENKTDKEVTVEVSTESVEETSNNDSNSDKPVEDKKKGDTTDAETTSKNPEKSEKENETEKEMVTEKKTEKDNEEEEADTVSAEQKKLNDETDKRLSDKVEKTAESSAPTQDTGCTTSSDVADNKNKSSTLEETEKPGSSLSGFNFTSQSTSIQTPGISAGSNKPPPIIFGNAATATTHNVEKAPTFTGFNFSKTIPGGKATPFSGIQFTPVPPLKDDLNTSERPGKLSMKKRSLRAGNPYDFGKSSSKSNTGEPSKETDQTSQSTPAFQGFDFSKLPGSTASIEAPKDTSNVSEEKKASKSVFPGYDSGKLATKTTNDEKTKQGEKSDQTATPKPALPGYDFGKLPSKPTIAVAAAEAPGESARKNPFAGFSFYSSGSSDKSDEQPAETGNTKPADIITPTESSTKIPGGDKEIEIAQGTTTTEVKRTPTFTFGNIKPTEQTKEPSSASNFTFGAPATQKPKETIAKSDNTKPTVSPFTFGSAASASTSKTPAFGGFGTATTSSDKSNEPSKTPIFGGFGTAIASNDKSNEPSKTPTFGGFGTTTTLSDKSMEPSEASAFSFGAATNTTSDDKSKETNKPSSFTFGKPATTSDKTFTFGNISSTDKSKEIGKVPAFSFGASPSAADKSKEGVTPPPFSFGSATSDDKSKEATKTSPFTFGTTDTTFKPSAFNFGSSSTSDNQSKDTAPAPPMFKFGNTTSEAVASNVSFGSSSSGKGAESTDSPRKKRQLEDSSDEGGPPASKKSFSFSTPSAPSIFSASKSKKRQLDDDDEETPSSQKKQSIGFTAASFAGTPSIFGDKTKTDTSKTIPQEDKENQIPAYVFGDVPSGQEKEEEATSSTEKTSTSTDLLPKTSTAKTTTTPAPALKKPSPLSKEITFAATSKPAAPKLTGSVATAFSKKETVENSTLNVRPVKLISSELSAEIATLKSDMISFSDEILQTRFWQLSTEVQQTMTAFDTFVNAQKESYKRFQERTESGLKDTLTATTEKIKTLSMDADTLSKMQHHVTDEVDVFKKRVELQKRNVGAAKDYRSQNNIHLQERDENINWQYISHIAGEMESRLEEYQQLIPSMEESISKMKDNVTPSIGHINSVIDNHGKLLVKMAGRIVKNQDDIQFVRLTNVPPHK